LSWPRAVPTGLCHCPPAVTKKSVRSPLQISNGRRAPGKSTTSGKGKSGISDGRVIGFAACACVATLGASGARRPKTPADAGCCERLASSANVIASIGTPTVYFTSVACSRPHAKASLSLARLRTSVDWSFEPSGHELVFGSFRNGQFGPGMIQCVARFLHRFSLPVGTRRRPYATFQPPTSREVRLVTFTLRRPLQDPTSERN
jgi:hypothetical protein